MATRTYEVDYHVVVRVEAENEEKARHAAERILGLAAPEVYLHQLQKVTEAPPEK